MDGISPVNEFMMRSTYQTPSQLQANNSLVELLALSEGDWMSRGIEPLTKKLIQYCNECIPLGRTENSLGLLEKKVLYPDSKIAMVGDIYGNSNRFELSLRILQERGYLDQNFKIAENVELVFLGNYFYWNSSWLKLLEFILTIKLENCNRVHLIQGKHDNIEYVHNLEIPQLVYFFNQNGNKNLLDQFFQSLPIMTFIGQKSNKQIQFVPFCAAQYQVFLDLYPFLEDGIDNCYWIEKPTEKISQRVWSLIPFINHNKFKDLDSEKLSDHIKILFKKHFNENNLTIREGKKLKSIISYCINLYFLKTNINDIHKIFMDVDVKFFEKSKKTNLDPEFIEGSMKVGSVKNKIKLIVQGTKYGDLYNFCRTVNENKTKVITFNPQYDHKEHVIIIFDIKEKVKEWKVTHAGASIVENYEDIILQPFVSDRTPKNLAELMNMSDYEWDSHNIEILNDKMKEYCKKYGRVQYLESSVVLMEKHDLEPNTKVYMVGDLHGNSLRLELTFKLLQKYGLLDERYKFTNKNCKIVFLGDYVDRGENSLKVLELLITFALENFGQVFLLRGNHEDISFYSHPKKDGKYLKYMLEKKNQQCINDFYQNLIDVLFLGEKKDSSVNPQRQEYFMYFHGGPDIYLDPYKLIDCPSLVAWQWFNNDKDFSPRVKQLIDDEVDITDNDDSSDSPRRIKKLMAVRKLDMLSNVIPVDYQNIHWLDIGSKLLRDKESGRWSILPDHLKAYLIVSGGVNKIKAFGRGHQAMVSMHKNGDKNVGLTLDPSCDDDQIIVAFETASKIRNWKCRKMIIPLDDDHEIALLGSLLTPEKPFHEM